MPKFTCRMGVEIDATSYEEAAHKAYAYLTGPHVVPMRVQVTGEIGGQRAVMIEPVPTTRAPAAKREFIRSYVLARAACLQPSQMNTTALVTAGADLWGKIEDIT